MINKAVNNQNKLLSVINDIFIFVDEPYTKQRKIRINPALSENLLQDNIVKTRGIIMNLYVSCEVDYIRGIKIYESIVSKKILETSQNQIANLNENKQKLLQLNNTNINMKTQESNMDKLTYDNAINNQNKNSNNQATSNNDNVYSTEEIQKIRDQNNE